MSPVLRRLAGAAAASGLAVAGLVVTAAPASAAACPGSEGVTVVVDTGGSISTRCVSSNPESAWDALTAAGFNVTRVESFPGAICKIDGNPETACVRMPPASAYWAFFHAERGGSWVYSSSGVATYDPAPGSVVGFRFGSGQQPGIAPPAPAKTSAPVPTKPTTQPKPSASKPSASKPQSTTSAPKATTNSTATGPSGSATSTTAPIATATPSASGTASASASADVTTSASPGPSASGIAAAPASTEADSPTGPATLVAGAALVALVAGGAGWAAWKRRV